VTWADVAQYWNRPQIRIIEPFARIDLASGVFERKHPLQTSDESQITAATNGDDWNERLADEDWDRLFTFFREIEILPPYLDYLEFEVGGEKRHIDLAAIPSRYRRNRRGITFHVPRHSLMRALRTGYFDDLLIGNFMRTELHNTQLYPHFSPIVAKLRGTARVRTSAEGRRFKRRYFRRNPFGYVEWHLGEAIERLIERARGWADVLGIKPPLKRLYRMMLGDQVR